MLTQNRMQTNQRILDEMPNESILAGHLTQISEMSHLDEDGNYIGRDGGGQRNKDNSM